MISAIITAIVRAITADIISFLTQILSRISKDRDIDKHAKAAAEDLKKAKDEKSMDQADRDIFSGP